MERLTREKLEELYQDTPFIPAVNIPGELCVMASQKSLVTFFMKACEAAGIKKAWALNAHLAYKLLLYWAYGNWEGSRKWVHREVDEALLADFDKLVGFFNSLDEDDIKLLNRAIEYKEKSSQLSAIASSYFDCVAEHCRYKNRRCRECDLNPESHMHEYYEPCLLRRREEG